MSVYWIDHFVICTGDVARFESFHAQVLGGRTQGDPSGVRPGIFQDVGRCRIGGFTANAPLPPTRGLGCGLPRYGFYVDGGDVAAHLRRLDEANALHLQPLRIISEGEPGTVIYWQDPDGNQFEFWAPDVLPAGALAGCGPERVGRISHGVFESRDLDRTAAFMARYCGLEPERDAALAPDTLVLRLAAGGRLIFKRVAALEGRTTGCGMRNAHTALVVRNEDFFPNYQRVWAELPEWDFDPVAGRPIENGPALAPRTVLHPSPGGRRFHALTQRGDDWFDWDTNMFHFYGGVPVDGSMAVYEGQSVEYYIRLWEQTNGNLDALRALTHA